MLYNQGNFQSEENEEERQRGCTEEPYRLRLCVNKLSSLRLIFSFTLLMHTFRVIKGKEKKQIMFYTSASLSFSAIQYKKKDVRSG